MHTKSRPRRESRTTPRVTPASCMAPEYLVISTGPITRRKRQVSSVLVLGRRSSGATHSPSTGDLCARCWWISVDARELVTRVRHQDLSDVVKAAVGLAISDFDCHCGATDIGTTRSGALATENV